jgi:hypothetical protein
VAQLYVEWVELQVLPVLPLSREQVLQLAGDEGLVLQPSKNNKTGYKGVEKRPSGVYCARVSRGRKNGRRRRLYLQVGDGGGFATAEEAALCYARAQRASRSNR